MAGKPMAWGPKMLVRSAGVRGLPTRLGVAVACGCLSALPAPAAEPPAAAAAAAPVADAPVVEEHRHDPAKARAEFIEAKAEMKDLVAEMVVLQAEYQRPDADRVAVAAKFEATKQKAMDTSKRLETSAFALSLVDPKNEQAREICGAVVAAALESDDPGRAARMAGMLDKAGAATGDVLMMAAAADLTLSQLDAAAAWLEKARAAGAQKERVAELENAIRERRPNVEAEMARRKAEAEADDLPRVRISTSKGDVVVELFENEAPNTVANFVSLAEKGFYNGTKFHRPRRAEHRRLAVLPDVSSDGTPRRQAHRLWSRDRGDGRPAEDRANRGAAGRRPARHDRQGGGAAEAKPPVRAEEAARSEEVSGGPGRSGGRANL